MTGKKVRYFFEGIALYVLFGLFKLLPVDMASNLGGRLGKLIGPRLGASQKALKNLQIAFPDKPFPEQKRILTNMWENLGRVFAEYAHLKEIASRRVEISGFEEHIADLQTYQKPAILFSGHLSNWEVLGPSLYLQKGMEGLLVYRPPNNPYADQLLLRAREVGDGVSLTTKSEQGVREMIKCLRHNGIIGLLVDQKFNRGLPISFFGRDAMTSPAFVELALKFDARLIPVRLERTHGAHFRLTIEPALHTTGKTVEELLKETHTILEKWIQEHPEQWLWLHRRWGKFEEISLS